MIKLHPPKTDFDISLSRAGNEETVVQYAGPIFTFPLTKQQLESYQADENRFAYRVILLLTSTVIGHAEIFLPNEKSALLCRMIISDPANRGKGIGEQIVSRLLEISFTQLARSRVELNVFDWNIAAIRCFEKNGLTLNEARTKKRIINGQRWTSLHYSIDRTTWENCSRTGNSLKRN